MIMFMCVIYLTVIIRGEMIHLSSPEELVLVNKVYLLFIIYFLVRPHLSLYLSLVFSPFFHQQIIYLSNYLFILLSIHPISIHPISFHSSDVLIRDLAIFRYTDNYFRYVPITDTDPILYLLTGF